MEKTRGFEEQAFTRGGAQPVEGARAAPELVVDGKGERCDLLGVVAERGLNIDAAALCRKLGVGRIDLSCVPAGQARFAAGGEEGSWIADVSTGVEAYRAHLKKHRNKIVRQTNNRMAKLADEHGALDFSVNPADRTHFKTLVEWKLTQLRAAGQPAIWAKPWVRRVLESTSKARWPGLSGVFVSMTAGDKLVAATYALRSERVLHVWMIGHDNAYDAYSPGVILARWLIEWAAEQGLAEVDFGVGDYQFKRHLATRQRALVWGAMMRPSLSGAVRSVEMGLRTRMEALPNKQLAALPGKAMRRLDLMRALAA